MTNNGVKQVDTNFEKNSRHVFQNNIATYTQNDKEFLHKLTELFGEAMSFKGLNVADPIYANFFHYNKMGMRGNVDYPRVTRTYAFFTRPELNFSFENINAIPFFKWLYSKRIGKMIMASLTDPEYFVYGPAALNSSADLTAGEIMDIVRKYVDAFKDNDQIKTPDNDYNKFMSTSEEDAKGTGYEDWDADQLATMSDAAVAAKKEANDPNSEKDSQFERERLEADSYTSLYDESMLETIVARYESASLDYYGELNKSNQKWNSNLNKNIDKLNMAFNNFDGYDLATRMNQFGLRQAKHILRDTHDGKEGSDFFNFTSPFIPLLNNTCTNVTGAKDFNLEVHTYEEDEFSGQQNVATGMDEVWSNGSLSTNFEDIAYGPVGLMMMVWVLYIHYVSRGYITSTRQHVTERILDYTCSCYVFVIGEDGRRIERWGKYTGCYPTTYPLSQQLEHNTNIDHDVLQKITISWKYNRYEPMDPQVFTDFNFLSESEWLVKLQDPFWESLYRRTDPKAKNINQYADNSMENKQVHEYEKELLNSLDRPSQLWEVVKSENRGMSGFLPPQMIGSSSYTSPLNLINNYWGGYPYINKGTELIWVLPQFGTTQGVVHDTPKVNSGSFGADYTVTKETDKNGVEHPSSFSEKTGYDKQVVSNSVVSGTSDIEAGNATGLV